MKRRSSRLLLLVVSCYFLASTAYAHRPSDGFLSFDLANERQTGRLQLHLRDLEVVMQIDADGDGQLTWGELRAKQDALMSYAAARIGVTRGGEKCAFVAEDLLTSRLSDGVYAAVDFHLSCPSHDSDRLTISYEALFDVDAQHRGMLSVKSGEFAHSDVFSSDNRSISIEIGANPLAQKFAHFVWEGMIHIAEGYDHILFMIAMLVPAVYRRRRPTYEPYTSVSAVIWETAKVASAFTLSHSISLVVTTFDLVYIPASRVVEGGIALSVLLTAMNNIFDVVSKRQWLIGLGFGFVHGIGFAGVLTDLGLNGWALVTPLLGFNLGVEFAQLVVILIFLPVAYQFRRTSFYRYGLCMMGSVITGVLALLWFMEQVLDRVILGF